MASPADANLAFHARCVVTTTRAAGQQLLLFDRPVFCVRPECKTLGRIEVFINVYRNELLEINLFLFKFLQSIAAFFSFSVSEYTLCIRNKAQQLS